MRCAKVSSTPRFLFDRGESVVRGGLEDKQREESFSCGGCGQDGDGVQGGSSGGLVANVPCRSDLDDRRGRAACKF